MTAMQFCGIFTVRNTVAYSHVHGNIILTIIEAPTIPGLVCKSNRAYTWEFEKILAVLLTPNTRALMAMAPKNRGPKDNINIRISHSGFKDQCKGDT